MFIFLQEVPEDVNLKQIKNRLLALDHVESLHHTHIWSLEGVHHVFSTHMVLENISEFSQIMEVKRKAKEILKEYPFKHYTIETELDEEKCELR
jgi:cobalt-zinc-cadmium efflux system protein